MVEYINNYYLNLKLEDFEYMKTYKPEGFGLNNYSMQPKYTIAELEKAIKTNETLSGYVTKCDQELGLVVKLGESIQGYIPFCELEYSPYNETSKSIAAISKVGKVVNFKVVSCEGVEYGADFLLSRKQSMKEAYDNFISNLKTGDIVDARITHVESYGAFCDIACGLTYLLPIENFCVTRVGNAKEALQDTKAIKVVILGRNKNGKIVLTHKELLGTWDEEVKDFEAGNVVAGTVRSVEDYGVFVEITPNLSGLAEPTDKVKPGDRVNVLIKSIIPEKMKIKLSILELDNKKFENDPRINVEYRFKGNHIDYWKYSSEKSDKIIETKFEDTQE